MPCHAMRDFSLLRANRGVCACTYYLQVLMEVKRRYESL